MKVYETEAIRNLAVIGHGDAGKTQLSVPFSTSPEPHRAGARLMKEQLLPITKRIQ
jgi:Translation elongation factors (GTPases)